MSKKYWGLILVLLLIYGLVSYYYTVNVNNENSNWNYNELQKISKNESNFSFAVYGDSANSDKRFGHLIHSLNEKNVLFSIDNGDLTTSGTSRQFGYFLIEIKQLKAPVLTNIGNHDLYSGDNESNYINMFGDTYYSFAEKNSYFIVLDDANSDMDSNQINWLKNELKKSQKYKYRFIFMHIPLYDPRYNSTGEGLSLGNSTTAKTLNDVFDESNITMLFTSHIHGYFRGMWGKTPFITTGGAGSPLSKPPAGVSSTQNYFYNYVLVNVTDKGVSYDVVRYN
ncbi:metallophosphoesterase family protein [Methanobacterium sp.]|uniref:metallophosphoesterase family protein n=1 Tax=Methanobacterium sp. TaxID=2164 RepID=UPI003C71D367